jgi:CDP-glucose 4,6-dehydratase
MESLVIDNAFWLNRRVFLTGHTGFKGGWLVLWLKELGAHVTGYSLPASTEPSLYDALDIGSLVDNNILADICDGAFLKSAIEDSQAEIVIHMAAQPLVRDSYDDPVATYATNVMGTVNLLEAVRKAGTVKAVLNITTDKCYENKEWIWGYREDDALGGHDPYSNSKACAELVSSSYRNSFLREAKIQLATARAGNVIGGGDWSKDRIIPDAIKSFVNSEKLIIRNPKATRPWQHVLEPLAGYLMLCKSLLEQHDDYDQGWNFGPNQEAVQPVSILADKMTAMWGDGAAWGLDSGAFPHEALSLKLDCSKSQQYLGWNPIWSLDKTLSETVNWYKCFYQNDDILAFTLSQIKAYQKEMNK